MPDAFDDTDETAADEDGSGSGSGGHGLHGVGQHPALHPRAPDRNKPAGGGGGGGGHPCEKLCSLREYFKAPLRYSWQPISWSWERQAVLGAGQLARDVDAAVFVYSVASRASFEGVRELWEAYRAAQKPAPAGVVRPAMVVACKADLPRVEWAVGEDEGLRFADAIGAMFTRCSAKDGFGVREVYVQMLVWTLAFNFKLQQAWQSDGHDQQAANRY